MTDPTFTDFYTEVHGRSPFPWQRRLADQVGAGDWPRAIQIPTGMGKTSVIDVAVFALAVQAVMPASERTARTRTALVVDRRLVVDSAFAHAEEIAGSLENPVGPVTEWAGAALRSMSRTGNVPLKVVRMRGGVTWAARWLDGPDQPAVIVGTVDQFGSRLLFRGYGTSDRMKPIDAGLLGNDTLLLLDEAHISQPLVDTVNAIRAIEAAAPAKVGRSLAAVSMTATNRPEHAAGEPSRVLRLDDDDLSSSAVNRLLAHKHASLVVVDGRAAKAPEKVLTELALGLVHEAPGGVIGVVVNTIGLARAVFAQVAASNGEVDCELVIGRCRPIDRAENEKRWLPRTKVGRRENPGVRPFILVATQTIEVGVDLDLDGLVTQSASIDALVQRFGRVDRLGVLGETRSFVVRCSETDPVYGTSEQATWEALSAAAAPVAVSVEGVSIALTRDATTFDFNSLATSEWLEGLDVDRLMAATAPSPLPTPVTVSWWRRTSPIPEPDEDIAPYLHGIGRWSPSVSVAWRCDVDSVDADEAGRLLAMVPLDAVEMAEVPLSAVRAFLTGVAADATDLEGADLAASEGDVSQSVWVWRDDRWTATEARGIRPGDVVVMPSSAGGHDRFGWTGAAEAPVVDVGGLGSRRLCLRINEAFLEQLLAADRPGLAQSVLTSASPSSQMADLFAGSNTGVYGALLEKWDGAVRRSRFVPRPPDDEGEVVEGHLVGSGLSSILDDRSDDDESTSFSVVSRGAEVSLDQHLRAVGDRSLAHAQCMGLPSDVCRAVELAGRFHDLGKAEARFQVLLHHGSRHRAELGRLVAERALAKSSRLGWSAERAVARGSGWPQGMRHEAISLELVRAAPAELFEGVDRQLVEHLVASHHGHARPFFPPVSDEQTTQVEITFDGTTFAAQTLPRQAAIDHAGPFERLCLQYGSWGLALLEAAIRLADMSVSEEGS